mgnify:CR=1 FL=1
MPLPLKITGVGRYLPKRVVPSSEVELMCGVRPGWIEQRTGVKERRWANGETSSFMGAEAAKEAVKDAGLSFRDIDLILNASGTPEQAIPDTSVLIQRELGLGEEPSPEKFEAYTTAQRHDDTRRVSVRAVQVQDAVVRCAVTGRLCSRR